MFIFKNNRVKKLISYSEFREVLTVEPLWFNAEYCCNIPELGGSNGGIVVFEG